MVTQNQNIDVAVKSIASEQTIITIEPGETLNNLYIFPDNTMLVATFYINNQQDIPSGSTGNIIISLTDSRSGHNSQITLNSYIYGRYLENYPVSSISITNNYTVEIEIYFQYTLKEYSQFANPVIQDLTELLIIPTVLVNSLTGGTNFRYYGSLSNTNWSNMINGASFYVLDQQVYGTSSTSAGYVQVPYTSNYTENINVSALGASEDANIYYFQVDSTTTQLPTSATQSNANMNWLKMDFYSPLYIKYSTQTYNIIYNSTNNDFEVASNTSLPIQNIALYMQNVNAPFSNYKIV